MSPSALLLALSLSVSFPFPGKKPAPDRWFGEDKLKHFFTSFVVTSISAGAARAAGLDPAPSVWAGAGAGAAAGAWKELRDKRTHKGTPSFRDLAWDAMGITAAAVVVRQAQ